jgi:hypothetical protein
MNEDALFDFLYFFSVAIPFDQKVSKIDC